MVLRKHTDSDVAEIDPVGLTEFIDDTVCNSLPVVDVREIARLRTYRRIQNG